MSRKMVEAMRVLEYFIMREYEPAEWSSESRVALSSALTNVREEFERLEKRVDLVVARLGFAGEA